RSLFPRTPRFMLKKGRRNSHGFPKLWQRRQIPAAHFPWSRHARRNPLVCLGEHGSKGCANMLSRELAGDGGPCGEALLEWALPKGLTADGIRASGSLPDQLRDRSTCPVPSVQTAV